MKFVENVMRQCRVPTITLVQTFYVVLISCSPRARESPV